MKLQNEGVLPQPNITQHPSVHSRARQQGPGTRLHPRDTSASCCSPHHTPTQLLQLLGQLLAAGLAAAFDLNPGGTRLHYSAGGFVFPAVSAVSLLPRGAGS